MASGNPIRSDSRQTIDQRKRKQTLLALLDALNELNNQELDNESRDAKILVDDEQGGPSTDDQLQTEGAEAFKRFQSRVQQLDKELQNFENAVTHLGSSVGIVSSSYHLRERLHKILSLFRETAADLFPRQVQRDPGELNKFVGSKKRFWRNQSRSRKKGTSNTSELSAPDIFIPESFPEELELLARDAATFGRRLNEFPGFADEAVNASILAFEGDLRYWASCLEEFEGQFRYPAVQRYIHDLSGEMCEHLISITNTIGVFIEIGVPTIRLAQNHDAATVLNLSTVATFFSAVTATTIQLSFSRTEGPFQNAVNAFWLSSLVCSIASAVHSVLGLTWKQAMFRSPPHRVPWWVMIWIKQSPVIFLGISAAAFSAGLVLFTWSSQNLVTCIVMTIFTGISSCSILAVCAWFAFERLIYSRHEGKRWLADILADIVADVRKYTGLEWAKHGLPRHTRRVRRWSGFQASRLEQTSSSFARDCSRLIGLHSVSASKEDTTNMERTPPLSRPQSEARAASHVWFPASVRLSEATTGQSKSPTQMTTRPPADIEAAGGTEPPTANRRLSGKGRFASAVRSVIMLQSASPHSSPPDPASERSGLGSLGGTLGSPEMDAHAAPRRRRLTEPFTVAKLSRIIMLSRSLKHLDITETLPAHQALVRHLQFSPNGKWLASCSWDRTGLLFKVGHGPFMPHRTLAHPQGFVHQVAWAPKGGHLLTRLHRSVKVWTEDGVCTKNIKRDRAVQSVTWLPSGRGFLSVEGSEVNEMDVIGMIMATYRLPRLTLHDVAVTPDEKYMLGVATLTESPLGLQPRKAGKEKRIVVYNLVEREIEHQVPVMHNVRDISVGGNGDLALVSYEDKASPQLWRLVRGPGSGTVRLSLCHTYMPNADVNFAGASYFGGKDDPLILSAGKNGHVHIWDRESSTLLHNFRAPDANFTAIAWNTASDAPMFATGSYDGIVKIWSTPLQQPIVSDFIPPSSLPSRSNSPSAMVEEFGGTSGR